MKTTQNQTENFQEDLEVVAPPWSHNPSSWRHRIPLCILAVIACLTAAYLALFQWGITEQVWDPFFGNQSEGVIDSPTSHRLYQLMAIPDAALGALAYLGDAVFGLAGSTRRWQYRPWLVILFGIDVIPLGLVSAILVFIQATIIGQWCSLCIFTAIISLILVGLAYDEVWSSIKYLFYVRKHHKDHFWNVFWGKRTLPEVEEEYLRKERRDVA